MLTICIGRYCQQKSNLFSKLKFHLTQYSFLKLYHINNRVCRNTRTTVHNIQNNLRQVNKVYKKHYNSQIHEHII